jgi:CheY-like chemotaxis protein
VNAASSATLPTLDRVLIVEDDESLREMMGHFLRLEGFVSAVAENGHDALERLEREPRPDVILLDLHMPVMDGWHFRAAQQRRPNIASIPVIVFSAVAEEARALDAAAVLTKPVDFDRLAGVIRGQCQAHEASIEAP